MSIGSPLITKYLAQQPLTRYKQQPCLFACSASLPAPPRVVSTWLPHSRDQRSKCCVAAIKVNTPAKENVYQTNAEFSLQNHKQTSDYSRNGHPNSNHLLLWCYQPFNLLLWYCSNHRSSRLRVVRPPQQYEQDHAAPVSYES